MRLERDNLRMLQEGRQHRDRLRQLRLTCGERGHRRVERADEARELVAAGRQRPEHLRVAVDDAREVMRLRPEQGLVDHRGGLECVSRIIERFVQRLTTGQRVRMDGGKGEIRIL